MGLVRMNPQQSARTVVVCAMLELFFVLAQARQNNRTREQTVKSLWAIGVLALGLSMASDFVPQVAGPFAILVLVALAARSRGELGQVLGTAASTPSPAASTSHPTRPGGESPGGPGRG